jgi:hypothetical protein
MRLHSGAVVVGYDGHYSFIPRTSIRRPQRAEDVSTGALRKALFFSALFYHRYPLGTSVFRIFFTLDDQCAPGHNKRSRRAGAFGPGGDVALTSSTSICEKGRKAA